MRGVNRRPCRSRTPPRTRLFLATATLRSLCRDSLATPIAADEPSRLGSRSVCARVATPFHICNGPILHAVAPALVSATKTAEPMIELSP
jgi:hypothetical protein